MSLMPDQMICALYVLTGQPRQEQKVADLLDVGRLAAVSRRDRAKVRAGINAEIDLRIVIDIHRHQLRAALLERSTGRLAPRYRRRRSCG